jgi:hypothetical protein
VDEAEGSTGGDGREVLGREKDFTTKYTKNTKEKNFTTTVTKDTTGKKENIKKT